MKQTIEIEVPDGKKAIWKDNKIIFEDIKPQLPRTWEEYFNFIDKLQKVGDVSSKKNLIIWVHNLSFEFQFIRKMVE